MLLLCTGNDTQLCSNHISSTLPLSTSHTPSHHTPTLLPTSTSVTSVTSSHHTPTLLPTSTSVTPSHHMPTLLPTSTSVTSSHHTPTLLPTSTSVTSSHHTPTLLPTSTSVTPPLTYSDSVDRWLYALLFCVFAAFTILTIFAIAIYRFRRTTESRSPFYYPKQSPSPSPQPLTTQVLLVYSLRTPTEEIENILTDFAAPLQLRGVRVIFYDMLCGRMGLPEWMERVVSESSKVFLLCNEQFKTEWEDSTVSSLEGNLIHILKQNFFAHVRTSSEYMSKYALLFMGSGERCLVSSYLHNLQHFVIEPSNPSTLDLARFITNTQSYILDIAV